MLRIQRRLILCAARLEHNARQIPDTRRAARAARFAAPVLEAYGMTEAAHQIASNPLPPLPRKVGTVGPAVGTEVAIIDDQQEQTMIGRVF